MKTQISRMSKNAHKNYSSVCQQQGRMITDSDLTEQALLSRDRLNEVISDVIGSGTPRQNALLQVTEVNNEKRPGLYWGKNAGRVYVDGVPATVRPDDSSTETEVFEYEHQLYYPMGTDGPNLPDNEAYRLYVDVWERSVTWLEDEALRDPGLHGADTTTRTQTVAQVKWCPAQTDPLCVDVNPTLGDAQLRLVLRSLSNSTNPCDPCANELEINEAIGNYLFRTEVHDVHYDEHDQPDAIVLKWSSENGAEAYKTKDVPPDFANNQFVYEFFDDITEKRLGVHLARNISNERIVDGNRSDLVETFLATSSDAKMFVRRWDGWCRLEKNASNEWHLIAGFEGSINLAAGVGVDNPGNVSRDGDIVQIELRVITLSINLLNRAVICGDFWTALVRESIHKQNDVLLDGDVVGSGDVPQGEPHHYMLLVDVLADGRLMLPDVSECDEYNACLPHQFPSLTDLHADDICYDNTQCKLPEVQTVQDALDHLCQENNLPWHNKHLHGWGIVCGLSLECDFDNPTSIIMQPGYALDCNGEDMILHGKVGVSFNIEERLEQGNIDIRTLDKDQGVCLFLKNTHEHTLDIGVELLKDEKPTLLERLQGTLLFDFYQDCIVGLIKNIQKERAETEIEAHCAQTKCGKTMLKPAKRRALAITNLLFHTTNKEKKYVLNVSPCEHALLKDLYDNLKDHLRSKTFCGHFSNNEFPAYPFKDKKNCRTTLFTPELLDHIRLHPNGKFIFGWKRNSARIYIFEQSNETCAGDLLGYIDAPKLEKGTITDIVIDANDNIHLSAIIHQEDTLLASGHLKRNTSGSCEFKIEWKSSFICGVKVVQMALSPWSNKHLYATAICKGVYLFALEELFTKEKIEKEPDWVFSASGHMDFDTKHNQVYATAFEKNTSKKKKAKKSSAKFSCERGRYNSIAIFNGLKPEDAESFKLFTLHVNKNEVIGDDGFVLALSTNEEVNENRTGRKSQTHLYVVINEVEDGGIKSLCRFNTIDQQAAEKSHGVWLGKKHHSFGAAGHVSLQYINAGKINGVVASRYAIHDIQYIPGEANFKQSELLASIPAQAGPVAIVANNSTQQIFILNYIGQSITSLGYELATYQKERETMGQYREDVIQASFGLLSGVVQNIKDCFCHHLLVECPPECDENDKVYLGCLSFEESKINHICNFTKRKYVKSFPTMGYWLSLIPIAPIVAWLVEEFCCLVLPNFFKSQGAQNLSIGTQSLGIAKAMMNAEQANVITELTTQGQELARNSMTKIIGAGYKDKNDYEDLVMLEYRYKPGVFIRPKSELADNAQLIAKVDYIDLEAEKNLNKMIDLEDKITILTDQKVTAEARFTQYEMDKLRADQEVLVLKTQVNVLKQEKTLHDSRFSELEAGLANIEKMRVEIQPIVEGGKSVTTLDGISEKDIDTLTKNRITSVKRLAEMNALELKEMGMDEAVASTLIENANARIMVKPR